MACSRCGLCCLYTKIVMPDNDKGRDGTEWVKLHGCKVVRENDQLAIIIPAICDHLYFDADSNHFACGIYDKRPQICRNYLCARALKEANMKPTLEDRRKTITDEMIALQKRLDVLAKQRQAIDREVSAIQARGNELNGQIKLLDQIKEDDKTEKPVTTEEETSKKDKKK